MGLTDPSGIQIFIVSHDHEIDYRIFLTYVSLFCSFFVSSVDDFGLGLLLKTQQVCYKFSEIRLTKWFYPRWGEGRILLRILSGVV